MQTFQENLRNQEAREIAVQLTLNGHNGEITREVVEQLEEELGVNALRNTVLDLREKGKVGFVEQGSFYTPGNPPRISAIRLT